jgi:hypothetical protein
MAQTDVIRTPDQRLRVFVSSTLVGPDEDPVHICGMDQAGQEIGAAIEELRELAHGIYPVLTDEGLAAAVEALCERAAIPVRVVAVPEGGSPGRWRPPRTSWSPTRAARSPCALRPGRSPWT